MLDGALCMRPAESSRRVLLLLLVALEDVEQEGGLGPLCCMKTLKSRESRPGTQKGPQSEERRKGGGGARRGATRTAAQTEGHSSNGVLGSSAKAVDARHTGGGVSSRTFDHILSSWRVSKWSTG